MAARPLEIENILLLVYSLGSKAKPWELSLILLSALPGKALIYPTARFPCQRYLQDCD